jgi:hypothetical protein
MNTKSPDDKKVLEWTAAPVLFEVVGEAVPGGTVVVMGEETVLVGVELPPPLPPLPVLLMPRTTMVRPQTSHLDEGESWSLLGWNRGKYSGGGLDMWRAEEVIRTSGGKRQPELISSLTHVKQFDPRASAA